MLVGGGPSESGEMPNNRLYSTKIDYRIIGIGMLWERRDDALATDDRISCMQGGSGHRLAYMGCCLLSNTIAVLTRGNNLAGKGQS